jgi:hypothetical protein
MGGLLLFGWKLWTRLRAFETAARVGHRVNGVAILEFWRQIKHRLILLRVCVENAGPARRQSSLPILLTIGSQMLIVFGARKFSHEAIAFAHQLDFFSERGLNVQSNGHVKYLIGHLAAVSSSISLAHFRIGQTMREAF